MPRKPRPLILSEAQCKQLAHIDQRGSDWRARQRARTLLMLHSGKSINIVAAEQGIDRDTVTAHRDAWLSKGIDGLLDAPRSGAPRKLATEHIQLLCDWARSEALSAPQLRARLHEQHHITVSVWIVQECLRRQGFIYKRTRHSLKKSETTPLLTLLSPSWHSSKPKPKEEK